MRWKSKELEREYNRKQYQLNKERRKAKAIENAIANRLFRNSLLNQFNCCCCGETDTDLIDWHHVDPQQKNFTISRFTSAMEDWWDEVLKCVPVCVLCHRKIHTNKLCLLSQKK